MTADEQAVGYLRTAAERLRGGVPIPPTFAATVAAWLDHEAEAGEPFRVYALAVAAAVLGRDVPDGVETADGQD